MYSLSISSTLAFQTFCNLLISSSRQINFHFRTKSIFSEHLRYSFALSMVIVQLNFAKFPSRTHLFFQFSQLFSKQGIIIIILRNLLNSEEVGCNHLSARGSDTLLRPSLTLSPPIPLRLYILPYWSNPLFLIFDILALWHSKVSTRAPECQT